MYIKSYSCNCNRPRATVLERTHGDTVDAWAGDLCLECYQKEQAQAGIDEMEARLCK